MQDFSLLRATFRETRRRLWWLIPPALILCLVLLGPSLVPGDLRSSWTATAVTQFAWGGVWWLALPAMLIEAGRLGSAHRQRNQHLFWRGAGLGRWTHLFSLVVPVLALGAISALLACAASLAFGYRSMMETGPWVALHLQALLFFLVAAWGLTSLTVGLAVSIGSAAALMTGLSTFLAGLLLTTGIDEIRIRAAGPPRALLELVSSVLPQFRFADLTDRIVYQWGALSPGPFGFLLGYHLAWAIFFSCLILRHFRPAISESKRMTFPLPLRTAVSLCAALGLGAWLFVSSGSPLLAWRTEEASLGFNPFAAQRTGLGEMLSEILVRQVDVAWHGGGKGRVQTEGGFLCDRLQRDFRELTTPSFAATPEERLHSRQRAEVIVRVAFCLSPSNMQAYQAYFHLLLHPGALGELLRPDTGLEPSSVEVSAPIRQKPEPVDYARLREISLLSLKNLDPRSPAQCLAAGWVWYNLFSITPREDTANRRRFAREMTGSLALADSGLSAGNPVPPQYPYQSQRAFLGKLCADIAKAKL